jgi:6-phosphogluconolactonase (cycloisomerase 2 family)
MKLPFPSLRDGRAACLGLAVAASFAALPARGAEHGAVYVLSNQPTSNAVLVYDRAPDGALTYAGTYETGGRGAGSGVDPLGSQGSIAYRDGYVYAVNAGSNEVSVFRAAGTRLELLDRVGSGGTLPVSLDVKGRLLYVLNAGGTPNVSGFVFDAQAGRLWPLPDSRRPLAGGSAAAPAEVHFSQDGEALVVTEKGTQQIDTYRLDADGYAAGPLATGSHGAVPFGFAVTRRGDVLVSEAGTGSVSSYALGADGQLQLVSASVGLGQQAVCWLIATRDGRYAYTANAGSSTLSSLAVTPQGGLQLLDAVAASAPTPLDLALTRNGELLYVRDGTGGLTGFHIGADGSLSLAGSVAGVPAGAQGIAAQ